MFRSPFKTISYYLWCFSKIFIVYKWLNKKVKVLLTSQTLLSISISLTLLKVLEINSNTKLDLN